MKTSSLGEEIRILKNKLFCSSTVNVGEQKVNPTLGTFDIISAFLNIQFLYHRKLLQTWRPNSADDAHAPTKVAARARIVHRHLLPPTLTSLPSRRRRSSISVRSPARRERGQVGQVVTSLSPRQRRRPPTGLFGLPTGATPPTGDGQSSQLNFTLQGILKIIY